MISKVYFILILLSYVARQQGSNGECNLSPSFIFQTGCFAMPVEKPIRVQENVRPYYFLASYAQASGLPLPHPSHISRHQLKL